MRAIVAVLVGFFASTQSFAYIPPAEFIIKAFAKQQVPFVQTKQSIVFNSTLTLHELGLAKFKIETQYLKEKRLFKIIVRDLQGNEILNKEKKASVAAVGPALLFFTEYRSDVFVKYLAAQGIEVPKQKQLSNLTDEEKQNLNKENSVNFSRLNNTVCWKIGNEHALWIEKDTFLPVKFSYVSEVGKATVFWENFAYLGDIHFPRKVLIQGENGNIFEENIEGAHFTSEELLLKKSAEKKQVEKKHEKAVVDVSGLTEEKFVVDAEAIKKIETYIKVYK